MIVENPPLIDDKFPFEADVDHAYEIMSDELSHWQVVGPLAERRTNLPDREYWNAVRTSQVATDAEPTITITHLKDRAHAIACVQWHGLKAVLAAFERELAPSASSTGGNDNER